MLLKISHVVSGTVVCSRLSKHALSQEGGGRSQLDCSRSNFLLCSTELDADISVDDFWSLESSPDASVRDFWSTKTSADSSFQFNDFDSVAAFISYTPTLTIQ